MRIFFSSRLAAGLATCLLMAPVVSQAAVYKCRIQGEDRYQDTPCPGQAGQAPYIEDADLPPPPAVVSGGDDAPVVLAEREGDASVAAAAPPQDDDRPLDALGTLYFAFRAAQEEQRDLQRQYRAEVRRLAAAQAGQPDTEEAAWQRRDLDRVWREQQMSAADRTRRLQAELKAACPNGTMMQGNRPACR